MTGGPLYSYNLPWFCSHWCCCCCYFSAVSISLHGHSFVFITEPPPECTLEDRSPDDEEPMPEDLDLDDPCSLPPTERPPDQPLPMAMTNKTKSNNQHGDPRTFLFCFILVLVLQHGLRACCPKSRIVSRLTTPCRIGFFELIRNRREFRGCLRF